jgi:hypothetical protein
LTQIIRDTATLAPSSISMTAGRQTSDVQVLYIAGLGRSGSTLLCRTLGAVDGFLSTGELMRILGRGVITNDLCSCGAPVGKCELWQRVLHDLFARCPNLDLERLEQTRRRITEDWEFLRFLFFRRGQLDRDLHDLRRFLAELYRSIHAVTNVRVVVDASKSFMFAKLLCETPGVRVNVVHLVRDSRGVAHSLAKKTPRPGTSGRVEHFGQHGAFVGSVFWSAANVATECLSRWTPRGVRVRYEDFIANPSGTVRTIVQTLYPDLSSPPIPHVNGHSVHLGIDHLIASNPNRSRHGDIELQEDLAWHREMSATRRWVVTGLTFPLLRRYGYRTLPVAQPHAKRPHARVR